MKLLNISIKYLFMMKEQLILTAEIEEWKEEVKPSQDLPNAAESKRSKVIFYLLWIIVWFIAGTKLECLGLSKMNKIWINFVEHVAIAVVSLCWYLFYYWSAKKNGNKRLFITFKDKRILFFCMLSGIWDAWGNLVLIFAIKFSFQAEVSPASISCMLMTNIILVLVFSIVVLREKHCWMEYFGGFLIIVSVVIISYQRGGSSKRVNR